MPSSQATLRTAVRAVTVIVPFAMSLAVGAGWWAKGAAPPVQTDALGVTLDGLRVVGVRDPDAGERKLERAATRVAPGLDRGRLSLMDHRRARYVLGRVSVPALADIPEGSHLYLAVTETEADPRRTSSWIWVRGGEAARDVTVGWSHHLDDAADSVPWLTSRGTTPTASPSAVEVEPGDDLLVYAGLAEGSRVRSAEELAVGLVWIGPSGRLWGHERLS